MEFDVEPYYDDFESDSGARDQNYMRILFRPGYAVQARELTQMQSILQNQIKSFGDHIFQDGSPVEGGQMTLDRGVRSIGLSVGNFSLSDFNNQLIIDTVGSVNKKAIVVAVDDSTESLTQAGTLLVRYLTATKFSDGETIQVATDATISATTLSSGSSNVGCTASINEGIFYVDGFFVYVPSQTIALSSTSKTPTYRIGLEIDETIIDESTDTNLLDPAQGSFNYQAPGATRYQYNLILTKRTLDSVDDSRFFELLRVENGIITKQVKYPIYSELSKTLARRTEDQSGSFTVKPFRATASADSSNSSNVIIKIEPGKAYVKGFEYETIGITKLAIPKARSTSNSLSYDLSLEYGNFVTTCNVFSGNSGFLNISTFPIVDLHLVNSGQINTASSAEYSNTKIGTARIRDIEYQANNLYSTYLVDISTRPITVNAAGTAANSSYFDLPATFSRQNTAYNGAQVKVVSGTGSGSDTKVITNYFFDGTNRRAFVNRNFSAALDTTSRLSLIFGAEEIESLVVTPATFAGTVYATQNANTAVYPCMDVQPTAKNYDGDTILSATELNKMMYNLPESFIARNSFQSMNFYYRKFISKSTSSNTFTISSPSEISVSEEFPFVSTPSSYISGITANKNILGVVKNKGGSSFSNGQILVFSDVSGSSNKVQSGSVPNTITIIASDSTASYGANPLVIDFVITVKQNDAQTNALRKKLLIGNTQITTIRSTDSPTNGTAVTNATEVRVDSSNGIVWFTNAASSIGTTLKTPGSKQSLYITDVIKILGIYDSQNVSQNVTSTNALNITDRYLFDSGQRDNYYDHATISLKRGSAPPSGRVAVMCQYYKESGAGGASEGFFSADSYPQSAYDDNRIPYYVSEKYGTVSLRDVIDFRPSRPNGDNSAFTVSGSKIPYPYQSMSIGQYSFYLPRIDKLVLTSDGEFKMIRGTASPYPKVPLDSSDSLSLYNITFPAYTVYPMDVLFDYIDNKRYTMRDIGKLEKRIESLEYYTALSQLESQALGQTVLYNNNKEKAKHGILADGFGGFDIADINSPDLACHISKNNMRPYIVTVPFKFLENTASGSYSKNDKTYSVSYTEEPCIVQNTATKWITVQPYQFATFVGALDLVPETDFWFSSTQNPEVIVSATNTVSREQPGTSATDALTTGTSTSASTTTNSFQYTDGGNIYFPFVNWNVTFDAAGWGVIQDINWTAIAEAVSVENSSSQTEAAQTPTGIGGTVDRSTLFGGNR